MHAQKPVHVRPVTTSLWWHLGLLQRGSCERGCLWGPHHGVQCVHDVHSPVWLMTLDSHSLALCLSFLIRGMTTIVGVSGLFCRLKEVMCRTQS